MIPISRGEIEEVLKPALATSGDVTRCDPLLKGHGHQSFILETSSNAKLLLKIALRHEQLDKMTSLRRALELAARYGVPAPRLLYFSGGTVGFAGRPWLIQEFVPGEDGEDAMAGMSETQRTAFFRDFGSAVARLHAIDLGYFSEDLAFSRREGTWEAFVGARLERVGDRHFHADLVPRHTIAAARDVIRSMVRAMSAEVRPALVHRDLYLPNTLAAAGRFRCLLDFEHARSSDALSDFVKLQMWVFDRVPGSALAFRSGYGADPLNTREGRVRYYVWLGFELLSGLLYWSETGQSDMLADYRTRFERWLTAPPLVA